MTAIDRIANVIARCSTRSTVPSEVMVEVADLLEVLKLAKRCEVADSVARKTSELMRTTRATCETCALLSDIVEAHRAPAKRKAKR